ncbi:zinc finger protein 211-like [Sitodiplosis mosellana]|uniref:zinc finger protein 211-like n=1 Tax=Sitodiplosis mosellana TaxID=263140 RepID=UPI002444E7BF|nr:zinc finger protein 211-like [Sitodiplosis mosellana]
MNEHNNIRKPFECTTCNMRFIHINSWFRHRSRHTKNIHECEYCSESFNTLTAVKQHIQDMHKDHLKAYKCDQCAEEFALHFLLVLHHEWHKKAKPIICSTCNMVFFNERKLKAHIRDNHANHLCAECGKSFKTIHSLASLQMLHTEEKPFACDLCPSKFKWKAALRTHSLVHSGQKQHVCDICGSSFTTKGSMKKHKRIHTGDRRYQCDTCSLRFYSNDHLKRHIRTHTGERPYICTYCPRSFSQSNDLTKHLRSHVGQNMYQCSDCGESFRLQTELRKHSYTHYNKDDNSDTLKMEEQQ